jgi:two-component system sensor histidine kinase KdpD
VIEIAAGHLERAFASKVAVFTPLPTGKLTRIYASPGFGELTERDAGVCQWVSFNAQEAGLGTATLPGGSALHLPLLTAGGVIGVLSVSPEQRDRFDDIEQRRQLDAFGAQIALYIERVTLADETERARRAVETEQLRSSLLSSVSHDLRTPLAVITGAASTLVEGAGVDEATRTDLTQTILEEAERLNRLIRNLLDMTRLDSGTVKVNKEWVPLEEVVGAALNRLDMRLAKRPVRVELPPELPLLAFDAMLLEIVLINLLENALKYSEGPIEISASLAAKEVVVELADRGPGIAAGQELLVFDKFQRAVREGSPGGVGLGLAISRAIVSAHGGRIWVQNRAGGGAAFRFTLPIEGQAPALPSREPVEDAASSSQRTP